jgi:hypothetical protein
MQVLLLHHDACSCLCVRLLLQLLLLVVPLTCGFASTMVLPLMTSMGLLLNTSSRWSSSSLAWG